MRIAMYADVFYPFPGGVTTALVALTQSLAEQGHEIYVQAPRPKEEPDLSQFHPNIHVHYVRSVEVFIYPDFRIGTKLPLFIDDIRDWQPDIIHVHTPLNIGLEGLLVAKRLNIPVVHTFHTYFMDKDYMKLISINNDRLTNLLYAGGWRLTRAMGRLFDVTTAPSKYVLNDLESHRVPGHLTYCPNILREDNYQSHPRRGSDVKSFLFVGRLSPEKRVHLLLRSFANVLAQNDDVILHIIGDGPARDELVDLAFELGIGSNIHWHGRIPHDTLIHEKYYHLGDVFVTPSRFETFGYTTLEAMAHGLPVVALDFRANGELIGDTGFLQPDTEDEDEAVDRISSGMLSALSTDIRPKRKAAYERAQHYRPQEAIPLYEAAYQAALQLKSKEPHTDAE